MELIGNYWKCIPKDWIDWLDNNPGWQLPQDLKVTKNTLADEHVGSGKHINEDELTWFGSGYDPKSTFLTGFDASSCPYDFKQPFDFVKDTDDWWIVRYAPGQYMPWHRDVKCARGGAKTYWIPLTDWQPGHIFVYGHQTVSGYRAGDVFYQPDAWSYHCSVNIGHTLRMILQIRTYDELRG